VLLLAAFSGAAVALARRVPAYSVGWAWYLVTLLPVIGLIQVGGQARADRYLYLPMIGLGVAAAWGLPALCRSLQTRGGALAGPAVVALVALSVAASDQAGHWQSNAALFRHAIAMTRENWVAHSFLGAEAGRQGKLQEAMEHYAEAVRINPSSADMRYNLGLAYGETGRQEESIRELRLALHLDPALTEARYRLGVSLARSGRLPEAIETLRAASRALPDRFEVWNDLGDASFRLARFDEAEAAFGQALRLRPGDALVRWNLQQARARRTREPSAAVHP
jgi:Flp pilus assembly protein TadD